MNITPTRLRSFADELEKLAANVDLPTLLALLGGAGGAYAAYRGTHDPRVKVRNAILAALPSAGLGYVLGGKLSGPSDVPSPFHTVKVPGWQ